MKRQLGLLYVAFPAVLAMAQTSRPEHAVDGIATLAKPPAEQIESLPKKFPPEIGAFSRAPGRNEAKLTNTTYCVYPSLDRKSLSIRRCESVPQGFRLVSPLKGTAPEHKPGK